MRIGRRIPDVVIDAVDDAGQLLAPLPQHAFQPAAERIGLNLLGICRADRRQPIGKHHARLQQVELAVELHLVPVEILPVEPGQQHVPVPEDALIGQVVNRQQRGDVLVAVRVGVFDVQVGRDQRTSASRGNGSHRPAGAAGGSIPARPGRRTRTARSCPCSLRPLADTAPAGRNSRPARRRRPARPSPAACPAAAGRGRSCCRSECRTSRPAARSAGRCPSTCR